MKLALLDGVWQGLAVVLALALLVQTSHLSSARLALAEAQTNITAERASAAQAARAQADAYRKLEGDHHDEITNITAQGAARLAAAAAHADAADAAGQRLQHDIDQLVAAVRAAAADCTATGDCAPGESPLLLLADLQRRADARAGELAAVADDARERGSTCERAYDAARAMTAQAAGDAQ
jgi:hypothetical protein